MATFWIAAVTATATATVTVTVSVSMGVCALSDLQLTGQTQPLAYPPTLCG